MNEYQVACKEFDREILLGVLMRRAPAGLALTDGATYESTREQILAYERSSRTWDVNSVTRQVQPLQESVQPGGGGQGPAPTDVDINRAEKGGKKGGKGCDGGKGLWNAGWSSWFGKGKGLWNAGWSSWFGTGKGKSKDQKGKSKGKGKKGKSKGEGEEQERS